MFGVNATVDHDSAYNAQHTAEYCASYLCGSTDVAHQAESYLSEGLWDVF